MDTIEVSLTAEPAPRRPLARWNGTVRAGAGPHIAALEARVAELERDLELAALHREALLDEMKAERDAARGEKLRLQGEVDAARAETAATAEAQQLDLRDMRRFQASFIDADHKLRAREVQVANALRILDGWLGAHGRPTEGLVVETEEFLAAPTSSHMREHAEEMDRLRSALEAAQQVGEIRFRSNALAAEVADQIAAALGAKEGK